jgi:OOP family OmpA-OmpF porin
MPRRAGPVAVLIVLLGCKPAPPASPVAVAAPVVAPAPAPVLVDPTADRDVDGVPDARDRCPDEPEDRDEFEDEDGCVDRDNDGDGILDAHSFENGRWTNCDYAPATPSWVAVIRGRAHDDADVDCRNQPEDRDGVADHDGCPEYLCFDDCDVKLPERLHFDERGRFAADTEQLLDGVAATIRAVPTGRLWVDAHVDERRDDAAAKRLTQRIAAQAIEALVRHGVARDRLEPRGWGDLSPIAHNKTAEGRAANRRVEFRPMEGCPCGPQDTRPPEQHLCR